MANRYYLSDHMTNGVLMHLFGCVHLPHKDDRIFIGTCHTLNQASSYARRYVPKFGYCPYCIDTSKAGSFEIEHQKQMKFARKPLALPR